MIGTRSRGGTTTIVSDLVLPIRRPARPPRRRASIAYGIRSRSTPTEHTTTTVDAVARRPSAEHGRAVLDVRPRDAAAAAGGTRQPDRGRVLLQPPAQQALGRQPVERMLGTPGAAVRRHGLDHAGQRLDGRHVAVEEANASRSWAPTPTSSRTAPRVRVVDDPAHLEPAHLAGDHAVLDDRRGPAGLDRRDEGEVLGRRGRRQRAARRSPAAAPALDVPDRRSGWRTARPAGPARRCPVGQELEPLAHRAERPRQRRPEPTRRARPRRSTHATLVVDERGAGGNASGSASSVPAEVVADQRAAA